MQWRPSPSTSQTVAWGNTPISWFWRIPLLMWFLHARGLCNIIPSSPGGLVKSWSGAVVVFPSVSLTLLITSLRALNINSMSIKSHVEKQSDYILAIQRCFMPEQSISAASAPAMGLCHRFDSGWASAPWKDLSTITTRAEGFLNIEEALQQGYIRRSTLPAASSFFFVAKKDGGLRPCHLNISAETPSSPSWTSAALTTSFGYVRGTSGRQLSWPLLAPMNTLWCRMA